MLLTLSARSFAARLNAKGDPISLFDLPTLGHEEFEVQGLNLQTSYLAGWGLDQIDRLRDHADKSGCPWLTLIEEQPHDLATNNDDKLTKALDRMARVIRCGHRLGCSSVAMAVKAPANESAVEAVADSLREIISRAEQLELNLLVAPGAGLTQTPDAMTALIRKVGGFRIGSMPDFAAATASENVQEYLRALTPYASVVGAVTTEFDAKGKHTAFDLVACMDAIKSVGFEGALSVEYRGNQDPIEAVRHSLDIIRASLEDDA